MTLIYTPLIFPNSISTYQLPGGSNSRSLGHNNKGLHKQTDSFLHPQKSQECQLTTIYPALNGDPSQTFYRSTQNVHLCSSPHHLVQVFSVSRPLDDYINTNEHLLTTDIEKYLLCGLSLENLAVQYLCRILPGIDFSQSTRIFPTYKIKEASPYFWKKKMFCYKSDPPLANLMKLQRKQEVLVKGNNCHLHHRMGCHL